jgi:hypothetical protein
MPSLVTGGCSRGRLAPAGSVFALLGPNGAGKPVTGLRRSPLACPWLANG